MILRTFKPEDDYLSNQDFIERTGLPKATISRLTFTLVSLGYLIYDESSGRYRIGPATIALGYSGLSNHPVIMIAKPLMQKPVSYNTSPSPRDGLLSRMPSSA